jgi:hypothetical protein
MPKDRTAAALAADGGRRIPVGRPDRRFADDLGCYLDRMPSEVLDDPSPADIAGGSAPTSDKK